MTTSNPVIAAFNDACGTNPSEEAATEWLRAVDDVLTDMYAPGEFEADYTVDASVSLAVARAILTQPDRIRLLEEAKSALEALSGNRQAG